MAKILDGKALAQKIKANLAPGFKKFEKTHGRKCTLAVVLIGNNPASEIYIASKTKTAEELGARVIVHRFADGETQAKIQKAIEALNADGTIDGILLQQPFPKGYDPTPLINSVSAKKDVDGFVPGSPFTPGTPMGCIELLKEAGVKFQGAHAVVVGRSNIVGKPVAKLLLDLNCTVTVAHSKTQNLSNFTRQADILIVAVGKKHLITADMVKPGAVVIDVGINRENDKIYGDVDFDAVQHIASAITPVPGGVGPMTIACLFKNLLS